MKRRARRALITGIAGFLGRHMTAALLARGWSVSGLDNFSCSDPSALSAFGRRIRLVRGDVRDERAVRRALEGVDTVFHFAAIRSVARSVEDPYLSHEVNATGTLVLLDRSVRAGVGRFLFTSTSAVYGRAIRPYQKEDGRLEPISPYGMAKLLSEQYVRYHWETHGLPATSVRIFNVYGPNQNPESKYSLVVPGVLSRVLRGRPPVIDGSGEQQRDFIYVDDVLGALLRLHGARRSYGDVYNLGSGRAVSIVRLVRMLASASGSRLRPEHGPRRPGDPDRTCADISKIRRAVGWAPRVTLERGLEETVRWARSDASTY